MYCCCTDSARTRTWRLGTPCSTSHHNISTICGPVYQPIHTYKNGHNYPSPGQTYRFFSARASCTNQHYYLTPKDVPLPRASNCSNHYVPPGKSINSLIGVLSAVQERQFTTAAGRLRRDPRTVCDAADGHQPRKALDRAGFEQERKEIPKGIGQTNVVPTSVPGSTT